MLNLICKICPELQNSSSKIGANLAFNEKYLCFIFDLLFIEVIEYNIKGKKVSKLIFALKFNKKLLKRF